jgi:hypothetical protein
MTDIEFKDMEIKHLKETIERLEKIIRDKDEHINQLNELQFEGIRHMIGGQNQAN